ncbi:MAG: transposase [bacterium JZ-2024 1]
MGFDGDRRRKGTKVHAVVTAQGAPVGIEGTSAQKPEGVVFSRLLRRASVGRRTRPREVAGDGSSDSRSIRAELRRRGRWAWRSVNPRNRRGSRRGRPYRFDPDTDRVLRGAVERFFAWWKGGFRRLARRHERLRATFQGFVHLAGFLITWRVLR